VAQHHPEAVILEISLPDQSGLDVLRCIQQHDARIPRRRRSMPRR
jgi:DNA-binding NarL/FixJ family response regulator